MFSPLTSNLYIQDSLEYVPGRTYSKSHLQKGKAKVGAKYQRESRNADGIPNSRVQLLKFIKQQNRELQHFIDETDEAKRKVLYVDEFAECEETDETEGDDEDVGGEVILEEDEGDSDYDIMEALERKME